MVLVWGFFCLFVLLLLRFFRFVFVFVFVFLVKDVNSYTNNLPFSYDLSSFSDGNLWIL